MLSRTCMRCSSRCMLPAGVAGQQPRGRKVVARSGEGINDLISRDRKQIELTDVFDDAPKAADPSAASTTSTAAVSEAEITTSSSTTTTASPSSISRQRGPKTRKQRQADMAQAADAARSDGSKSSASTQTVYKRCKDAIDAGLAAFQAKDYMGAIDLFNLALELPGNGAYRLAGSPREYSCPSDAEEQAALYNMACCYAQLGQKQASITCLQSILESGFNDTKLLTSDPDLQPVQGPELQAVLNKYTGVGGMFTKLLKKNKDEVLVSDQNKNKPWIMW